MSKLYVFKRNSKAKLPQRASSGSVGYDLCSCGNIVVPPRDRKIVPTGISVRIPVGYYGRIAPKSGLSVKKKLDIGAGVIDFDYNGEIGVVLINNSDISVEINEGDYVAQLIIEKCIVPEVEECIVLPEFQGNTRGENGFGTLDEVKKN